MKRTMVIVMMLVVCGVALAGDPNSMEKPTAENPVTTCIKGNVVTLKMYFDDDAIEAIALDGSFVKLVRSWQRDVANMAVKIRLFYTNKLHADDSLAYLKNMVAAKEAAAKEQDPE